MARGSEPPLTFRQSAERLDLDPLALGFDDLETGIAMTEANAGGLDATLNACSVPASSAENLPITCRASRPWPTWTTRAARAAVRRCMQSSALTARCNSDLFDGLEKLKTVRAPRVTLTHVNVRGRPQQYAELHPKLDRMTMCRSSP